MKQIYRIEYYQSRSGWEWLSARNANEWMKHWHNIGRGQGRRSLGESEPHRRISQQIHYAHDATCWKFNSCSVQFVLIRKRSWAKINGVVSYILTMTFLFLDFSHADGYTPFASSQFVYCEASIPLKLSKLFCSGVSPCCGYAPILYFGRCVQLWIILAMLPIPVLSHAAAVNGIISPRAQWNQS